MRYLLILSVLFAACTSNTGTTGEATAENNDEKDGPKVTKRNYFIDSSISYSSFFFDSMQLVDYFTRYNVPDTMKRRMISFYNNRNYQFAWFSNNGPTEQARGFWNMFKYFDDHDTSKVLRDDSLVNLMDEYIESDKATWNESSKSLVKTEMKLTHQFIHFFLRNYEKGYIKRKEMEKFVPFVRQDAVAFADSLVTKEHKDDRYFDQVNENYGALKKHLGNLVQIQKNGGWPEVPQSVLKLKAGSSSPDVAVLKRRLAITGDLPVADTTPVWNDTLTAAINTFQERHGYSASPKLSADQLKAMNVPAIARIKQLVINLARTQWMIDQPKGRFIKVNIPEYTLHVTENGKKVFDMDVVVGKQGNNTTIFTGNLNQVVFSPYWNVPVSIIKKEILPAMEKNPDYLASHNMEVKGNLPGGLPAIRQLPGGSNALGQVKFLFPNSYDIYFHDTPSKSLFSRDKRAFSHGCIRLSDPEKMANYLLSDQPEWDASRIDAAMNAGDEKFVKVKNPVPVLITYYTAWVDDNGRLRFAEDIYGNDKSQEKRMFL